jgi:hypothetical protein
VESLERRDLMASLVAFREIEPNDVLTQAQALSDLHVADTVQVQGVIGNGTSHDADVDWYQFNVADPSRVSLALNGPGVLTLYDTDSAAGPLGHQQIGQVQGTQLGRPTALPIDLLPGTYYVAVSGAGNRYFNPELADSGTIGSRGAYTLTIEASAPHFDPSGGMQVVHSDVPAQGYSASPMTMNLFLSQPVDLANDYVTILYANQNDLGATVSFSGDTNDLVVAPAAPLDVGQYQVVVYDSGSNLLLSVPFTVAGREGSTGAGAAADTLATATRLNDITGAGLVQLTGAIGDDPFYNPANPDPAASDPANDVDIYRFTISGPGRHVLTAEAFAGRIGSPLNAALTLFRISSAGPAPDWQLVAGNDNSANRTVAADGEVPLYDDPVLFAGLPAGEYAIAVSATGNSSDPRYGLLPGQDGRFDPNLSHSGLAGQTTGAYVLNLFVQPAPLLPPRVLESSVRPGTVFNGPPTLVTVRFSAAMNLPELAGLIDNPDPSLPRFPAFIEDGAGVHHDLGLVSYDPSSNTATFNLLDRLTDGDYTLNLSGPGGLTDFAGDPLIGNTFQGDYVVPFHVTNSPALPATQALTDWQDSFAAPTDLGTLFRHDLAGSIVVRRDFHNAATPPQDQADYYRFTLTQTTSLNLSLGGAGLNVPGRPVLLDGQGNPLTTGIDRLNPRSHTLSVRLPAGTYIIRVGIWSPSAARSTVYELHITPGPEPENPTPLTVGPVPGYRLHLDSIAATAGGPPSVMGSGPVGALPQLVLPATPNPGVMLSLDRAPAGNAGPGSGPIAGALNGLAAGPVGVVGAPGAGGAETARLVLPNLSLPDALATGTDPQPPTSFSETGILFSAVEAMMRGLLLFVVEGCRIPQLMPRFASPDADLAPAADEAVPEEGAAPADGVADVAAVAPIDPMAWAEALAVVAGAGWSGDWTESEEVKRARCRPSGAMPPGRG